MAPEENAGTELLLQGFDRRFLAARTLRSFPWQSLEAKLRDPSDSELLRDILQKTVKHPVCVKHPPSVKYARCFLSELIKNHEAVHTEPLDELYKALAETLMAKESTQGHRSYLLPSGGSVTLSESTAIISHGTTGLVTWDAYPGAVEDTVPFPPARTVLELGSGAGLTGLAICKMCHPWAYIFSDPHRNVLLNGLSLEADITANLDSPRVTVDVAMVHQLSAFQPDIVIAADMLYCPEAIVSLVGVLWRLAACQEHKRTPEVYMAFTVHNPETCQLFTTKLAEPPRRAGIRWEAEAHHDQKLLPYGEHLETAMLNLTL
uniref:FAM86 N-terminal domain-containing protein n=1 Tax=Pan paniscus TaxID=9597 RepID=A0A2R8ZNP1_PANPA